MDAAVKKEPAFSRVRGDLRSQILGGQFPEGRALPTEAQIAIQYAVSRQTVRRAFQDLVAEGLVYRVAGRGTFATPSSGRYLRHFGSVENLMGLRPQDSKPSSASSTPRRQLCWMRTRDSRASPTRPLNDRRHSD